MFAFLFAAALVQASHCDGGDDLTAAHCWSELAEKADAELNTAWPRFLNKARQLDSAFTGTPRRDKGSRHKDMLAAQRAWLKFRDEQCSLESDYADGGSLQNVIYARCYFKMTRDRTKQLQTIVAGWEEF